MKFLQPELAGLHYIIIKAYSIKIEFDVLQTVFILYHNRQVYSTSASLSPEEIAIKGNKGKPSLILQRVQIKSVSIF
jgi:hypothetical protein